MSSDTWSDLQAYRSRQLSIREKLKQRKRGVEDLLKATDPGGTSLQAPPVKSARLQDLDGETNDNPTLPVGKLRSVAIDPTLEVLLLSHLGNIALEYPMEAKKLAGALAKLGYMDTISEDALLQLLDKLALQHLITLHDEAGNAVISPLASGYALKALSILSAQAEKISALHSKAREKISDIGSSSPSLSTPSGSASSDLRRVKSETAFDVASSPDSTKYDSDHSSDKLVHSVPGYQDNAKLDTRRATPESDHLAVAASSTSKSRPAASVKVEDSLESLLSLPSTKERETRKLGGEISELLNKPTVKERSLVQKFRSADGIQVKEFCPHGTKEDCARQPSNRDGRPCKRLHFVKIIQKHTDLSLGDCSFLNTCFHMNTCKYIHYEVDYSDLRRKMSAMSSGEKRYGGSGLMMGLTDKEEPLKLYPQQWIQCDLRTFDLRVLGKFSVIMADPPWDIHMELPYGTMSDDEMRNLGVQVLQEEGLIFLWVTGRAMELGRDCLKIWGYEQCDEIIWVKTNQLQRIIRTGRTGHWLNHGKEHCLVGYKGPLELYNRCLDCDVIVAEVRETSHKPDEIYGLIERLSPGTRKLELFGRMHNAQKNWITLGNQLDGVRLLDPLVVARVKEVYPEGNCMKKPTKPGTALPQ